MRVTASKVHLLQYCQAFAREDMPWDDRKTDLAERGDRLHAVAARYPSTGVREEVAEDIREEYARVCEWLDSINAVALFREGRLLLEVSYAWDVATDTAECIGSHRDYSKANGRLSGTADLVWLTTIDGKPIAATIWDWKAGTGHDAGPQLRSLALMVARTYGIEQVTVAALEVTAERVLEVAREELDAFGLSAAAGEIDALLSGIETSAPVPGAHCGELYCPARLTCPVGQVAVAEVIEAIPSDKLAARQAFRLSDPIETPEHAAWAVEVIRLVNAKLDAIKEDIKSKVPAEGWRCADGRVLKETFHNASSFSKDKALALCKELGATDEQIALTYFSYEKSNGLRVSGGAAKPRTKRTKKAKAA